MANEFIARNGIIAKNNSTVTGSLNTTGSLGVTGSFAVQTYDSFVSNSFVDAIQITDTNRTIYDLVGTLSINASARRLHDSNGVASIEWENRIGFDSTANPSIDWETRILYDPTNVSSIGWKNRIAYDLTANPSIDWENRYLYDSIGALSIIWSARYLADSNGDEVLNWDVIGNNYKIRTSAYLGKLISTDTQDRFSDVPIVSFNYEGEVIGGELDGTVAQFDLVYLETDGKWYTVTQGTTDCSKLLGICAVPGVKAQIILEGSITVNDDSIIDTPRVQLIDHGLPIYIRESAGNTMSTTVPTTAGQYVRILGHAYYKNTVTSNYWIMKFRPSNEWYVI